MDWKQEDGRLVAETDFGQYAIFIKCPEARTFGVRLDSGDDIHTMDGEYESIARAVEAAKADLCHREKMWETL